MLTAEEKQVGRQFRAEQQSSLLASHVLNPPAAVCAPFIKQYRHACKARSGRSISLQLKEMYILSQKSGEVPKGRFGFLYKYGECRACGLTVRSKAGRLVDAYERPPE